MRGNDIGEIGRRVGERVRLIRREREMTQEHLSATLAAIGRPMPTASIGRLESGDRRVDVDDLMALAYALDVSPLSLLLPFTDRPDDRFKPAGVGREVEAVSAWMWAAGVGPGRYDSGNAEYQEKTWRQFRDVSHPWWLQVDVRLDERLRPAYGDLGQPAFEENRKWTPPWWPKGPESADGEHQAEA
ncbi:transcriptional regulator with XRE-family HTH domain [Microbacterium sp. ZKA21]|uniref:helix-turn-helix domain-containing protein n=1 Tax=Microbacterium sp. ZKA21 TaxID=3381694 RepID=UPI003D22FA25